MSSSSAGRVALMVCSALAVGFVLYGCGASSADGGAEELAKQQELQAARAQAAQDAKQSAKIAELEDKLEGARSPKAGSSGATEPTSPETAVSGESPLAGDWEGEAVINYDDGRSDPFVESVRIGALRVGAVSGYAKALQGSTTCHGPLTYEGNLEGWYRFSSEEQNRAECIDYSEVELAPDGSGGLSYRETTESSLSSGRLVRVS